MSNTSSPRGQAVNNTILTITQSIFQCVFCCTAGISNPRGGRVLAFLFRFRKTNLFLVKILQKENSVKEFPHWLEKYIVCENFEYPFKNSLINSLDFQVNLILF